MPRRQIQLINNEFYHIIKRGFEEKDIFLDEEDFLRFINSLLVFNDKNHSLWQFRFFWHKKTPKDLTLKYSPQKPLVKIHAFVLMPNHFHLLVQQLIDNGISIFMQKLGGYSQYFNRKYQREGSLFPNRYKVVNIKTEEQLKNTFVYIHTNPIGLIEKSWKEWKVKNLKKAVDFLENKYRWSSYWDYLKKRNFPKVTDRDFFIKLFGGNEEIKKEVNSWIKFKSQNFMKNPQIREILLDLE
jgi:putative transposase